MFTREKVEKILDKAREIDSGFELFGVRGHQYKLNPPAPEVFVRKVEEKCGFALPSDYRRFITQVGDGGAGPNYGIDPFREFWKRGYFQEDCHAEQWRQEYRDSLVKPFRIRSMAADEVGEYAATCTGEAFQRQPERYFVREDPEEDDLNWATCGFWTLGTCGCQWDFGLALNGEHRGRVFTTDNEGGFALDAYSFNDFYSRYLEHLADTKALREELELWRGRLKPR